LKPTPFMFQAQPIPTHHNLSMYIGSNSSRYHATLMILVSFNTHAHLHTKPIIYNSWIMPSLHNTPLYAYFSSEHSYPNQYQSSKSKQAYKQHPVSPSPSLRLKGLAQARRTRSGEPPSPRRGLEKHQENHAGSRLGETPLTWARYSLAQK